MPATPPEIPYDVFISYSHADSDWVFEWLVSRLKDAGLRSARIANRSSSASPR